MSTFMKPENYDPFFNTDQTKEEHDDARNFDIKGFPFPLDRNNPRGFFYRATNHEVVKADLLQLLMTEPGERVMMPSFGTGLRRYMFEANDDLSRDRIAELVSLAISRWEPRIVVNAINVKFGTDEDKVRTEGRGLGTDSRVNVPGDNVAESSLIIAIEYSLKEDLENKDYLEFRVNLGANI